MSTTPDAPSTADTPDTPYTAGTSGIPDTPRRTGTPAPLLTLDGVTAGYGDSAVLHDVTLEVRPGEVVTLLGANGAGKTTTILTIAGLLPMTSGSLTMLGRDHAPRRRSTPGAVIERSRHGLAVVPDDRGLFANLTVAENLRLGRRRSRDGVDDRQILEWFPALESLQARQAGLLSGGEQQMLALARALVGVPRLLVIDELSMGLAPLVTEQLLGVVRRIATQTGIGVLIVEQHVKLALAVADRGYVLRRGRVVLQGPATELARRREEIEAGYLDG